MLFHLFCWLLIGVPCGMIGLSIEARSGAGRFASRLDQSILELFLGLAVVSELLLLLSLLLPVSPIALGLLLAIGVAIAFADPASRKQIHHLLRSSGKARLLAFLAPFAMLAAVAAADPIKIYDTGAYHYPLVRWLATTGTIPGLALLYGNFGFTSSWFALTAALDHGVLQGRVAGVFNGLVAFTAVFHFGLAGARALSGRALRSDWFLLGAYPIIFAFWYQLNYHTSPSPDLPVLVLLVLIGWRIMADGELGPTPDSFRDNLPLLILGGGLLNLKLSAAPVLLIVLLTVSARCRWALRPTALAALTACAFAAPLILANVFASGYPLYPSSALRVNAAWTLPAHSVAEMANVIKYAAYCGGPCTQVVAGWNWVVPWLHNPQNILMLLVSAATFVTFIIRKAWRFGTDMGMVLLLAEGGLVYVLLTIPNLRFAIGYISVCCGLCLASFRAKSLDSVRPMGSSIPLAMGIAMIVGFSFLADSSLEATGQAKRLGVRQLLLPESVPMRTGEVVTIKNRHAFRSTSLVLRSEMMNGLLYKRPVQGELCWAAELPCVPDGLKPEVVLLDPGLGWRAGFGLNAWRTETRPHPSALFGRDTRPRSAQDR